MKYAYYPGCSLKSTAKEFDTSTKYIAEELGIELVEIEDWICCGATPGHMTNKLLSIALPAYQLFQAQKVKLDIVAVCAECHNRLKYSKYEIENKSDIKEKVEEIFEDEYTGEIEVKHFLEVLMNDIDPDNIKNRIAYSLENFKIASYYGCLLVRSPEIMNFDDKEDPQMLDDLFTICGAEPVVWYHKTECCGASLALSRDDIVSRCVGDIVRSAKINGANIIAVACPLCQNNLDMRQSDGAKLVGEELDIPVLYFTQLLGIAFGGGEKELGLSRHIVSPENVIKMVGV